MVPGDLGTQLVRPSFDRLRIRIHELLGRFVSFPLFLRRVETSNASASPKQLWMKPAS
jgi:hypothetical protein